MSENKRIVILGIGNKMKGDDGFGIVMAEKLRNLEHKDLKIIECGEVPENFIDKIVAYNPDVVVLLDTIYKRDSLPGEIIILEDINSPFSVSTHSSSLKMFLDILKIQGLNFKTFLLGIVPKNIDMGEEISFEVGEGMKKILGNFSDYLLRFKKDA